VEGHLVRAKHAGATSYLLKTAPAEHVIAAVRDAAAGTASLSPELLTRLTQALRRPPRRTPCSRFHHANAKYSS
jgi:DNA-binding NarL/FixJ family response regulator